MGGCLSMVQTALPHALNMLGGDFGSDAGSVGDKNNNNNNNGDLFGPNSPYYPSLPAGAQKVSVRNVYDGDTLTLTDERRVRLLGIDSPEIKENQPFAQEAKEYTKRVICGDSNGNASNSEVWISFEPGQEQTDKYGRLLAFVWVRHGEQDENQNNGNNNNNSGGGGFAGAFGRMGGDNDDDDNDQNGGGFLCVNEGILAAGYASAYTPNVNAKTRNWDKLVTLQTQARDSHRGMWSASSHTQSNTTKYYKTANGSAYHHKTCEHLANIRNLTELTASKALAQGLHPCRTCVV